MRNTPDIYDRLEARLALIMRIAEMVKAAAKLPWDSDRGRRARKRVDDLVAVLKATPL